MNYAANRPLAVLRCYTASNAIFAPRTRAGHVLTGGRYTTRVISDRQLDAILAGVRRGLPRNQAAKAAGVTPESLRRWCLIAQGDGSWPGAPASAVQDPTRERIVRFVADLERAEAECFDTVVSGLYANATTLNPKTGWIDTQAADRILSKHPVFRSDWHEERILQVQQSGTVEHVHQLSRQLERLSVDELRALRDGQTPALPDAANSSQLPTQPDE